jgi:hypothetical protein
VLKSSVFSSALLLAALGTHMGLAQAEYVPYGVRFTVEYTSSDRALDPRIAVGNTYTGTFSIDSADLLQDGINKAGRVNGFSVAIENGHWTQDAGFSPWSWFAGFRGPNGLGGGSPGFDVVGGKVTNLRGGVFGATDFPFMDFSFDARSTARQDSVCKGPYCGNRSNYFYTNNPLGVFGGSLSTYAMAAPVPEPQTYAMLLVGLALVGFQLKRRQHAKAKA